MSYSLLPDQNVLINQAKDKVRAGCKALLIQGATGSGKTVIASEIISGAYRKEKMCFFIVPRRDLLRQTSQTLNEFGIPHSFIAAGLRTDPRMKIFVCSTSTLINRLEIIPDIAIIDETHYGGAGLDKIIKTYKAAGVIIIGLSATPWKLSGKGLGCWYDDMICGPSIRWLIDNKRLADYRAFAPDTPDLSQIKLTGGDYNQKQLAERMTDDRVLIGNSVKHYKAHATGKLGITFAVSIKHSEMLAQEYRDNGIPAMHMDGETPESERIRISRAFAMREILQLCCAELLCFGYDLASASGIKNVCIQSMTDDQPTKSLAKQSQKNGRNLRYDVEPHLFFDHAGNIREHGLPDSDREWTLADREKCSRDSAERNIAVRQCLPAQDADGITRGCGFCHKPAPICPNCKRVYMIQSREIMEKDGQLKEIEKQAAHNGKMIERKKRAYEEHQCESLADWMILAEKRGHKKAWAFMRHKNRRRK